MPTESVADMVSKINDAVSNIVGVVSKITDVVSNNFHTYQIYDLKGAKASLSTVIRGFPCIFVAFLVVLDY